VQWTDKQIYFDLYDQLSEEISKADITEGLHHLKLESVLQYVALPNLRLKKVVEKPVNDAEKSSRSKLKKPAKPETPDGRGRDDMGFIFKFLRDTKKVKHIIRVIVNDKRDPAHSDEEIEKALGTMNVEIWDWQKFDLCADTIFVAAPKVKVIHLYWGGNNAVLEGWSAASGLRRLEELKEVYLHVQQVCKAATRPESRWDLERRKGRHTGANALCTNSRGLRLPNAPTIM
jgi:hypothetical protein